MKFFALLYDLVDDMVNRRVPFREQHLRLGREAHARGELVFGGALTEPVDKALIVFHTDDREKVEAFARKDPYVTNGLAKKWEIRPWNVVIGNEPAPATPAALATSVLRQWTARTSQQQWPRYRAYFSRKVLPELRAVEGFQGATLYFRSVSDEVEILVETRWRSVNDIRSFAGSNEETAVISEEAIAMLTEYDRRARHFEIALSERI